MSKSLKNHVLERALPNTKNQTAFSRLELLLSQRCQSALAGTASNKDIDAVFDEELQNDN